jgi:hypothetical protein
MLASPEFQDTQKLFDKNPQLKELSKQLVFP